MPIGDADRRRRCPRMPPRPDLVGPFARGGGAHEAGRLGAALERGGGRPHPPLQLGAAPGQSQGESRGAGEARAPSLAGAKRDAVRPLRRRAVSGDDGRDHPVGVAKVGISTEGAAGRGDRRVLLAPVGAGRQRRFIRPLPGAASLPLLGRCRIARDSTAFNADYYGGILRAYYDGKMGWLNTVERGREYRAGDLWGSVGAWYAGRWWTDPAKQYIDTMKARMHTRPWRNPGF
jgi:hypothetical protein